MIDHTPPSGTVLCTVDDLPDGNGRVFTWGTGKSAFGILVLRQGDAVTAFVNRCPHFGIPLDHDAKITTFREFVLCSHHYAAFRIVDGYCVEGPCEGASLRAMPLEIDGARIRIGEDAGDGHDDGA